MSTRVSVPALWDATGNFLNGALVGVAADAYVVGIVPKPSALSVPGYAAADNVDTLLVKDVVMGDLYLDMTLDEWRSAIQPPQQSPNRNKNLTYTVGTDVPVGDTITDSGLYNITLLQVWIDGIEQDTRDLTYTANAGGGEGSLQFTGDLVEGQVVGVLGFNN